MDLNIEIDGSKTSDENSAKSPISTVKHFKKSMIVEYEKIEHPEPLPTTEDSQSSVSSATSNSSNTTTGSSGTYSQNSNNSQKSPTSFTDPTVSKKIKTERNDVTIGSLLSTDQK